MQTVLFNSTVFGPVHSRRLGTSLGINLTPDDGKICTFDCLYCEAGFNAQGPGTTGMATPQKVHDMLQARLQAMRDAGRTLDVITFSGNGEPTVHPRFGAIVDDTVALRDKYFPQVKISVLSNATQLHRPDVVAALRKVDNNILKLDSAVAATVAALDRPVSPSYDVEKVIGRIAAFSPHVTVQTMMLRGTHNGVAIDNTTEAEIDALCRAYTRIAPSSVMLYSIDRKTPAEHLQKIGSEELRSIAAAIAARTGVAVTTA